MRMMGCRADKQCLPSHPPRSAAKKREENIKAKESERAAKAQEQAGKPKAKSSKYSKGDVLNLHKVFREYDKDNSGEITLQEFTQGLRDKKAAKAPRPGEKSTLEERKANEGISIFDLSEGVFHEMDTDNNGNVRVSIQRHLVHLQRTVLRELTIAISSFAHDFLATTGYV